MITAAVTGQDAGRGWAIAMAILIALLLLGHLLQRATKPKRRGRRRHY